MRLSPMLPALCLASAAAAAEALPPEPPAQQPAAPVQSSSTPPAFLLGVQVGPTFPGVFNKLNVSAMAGLEGAYQLPFLQRQLGVFFQVNYTQPSASGTRTDARLTENGGSETYHLTIHDFGMALGLNYVLRLPANFMGFAAAGVDVHLSHSVLDQKASGIDLGRTTEDSTRIGYLLRLGGGYLLGPGYLTLELENEYTGIDHLITGDANTAHLSTAVGYLLRL